MKLIYSIYLYLFGYYILRVAEEKRGHVLDLFLRSGISVTPKGEDYLISRRDAKRLRAISGNDIFSFGAILGLPASLRRYRKRIGLFVGVLTAAFLLIFSSGIVWRVEVSGNESISDEEIVSGLSDLGFGIGTRIRGTDLPSLAVRYRLAEPTLSHVDIYCVGTVAYVRVRENKRGMVEESEVPSNLIATQDAIVESLGVEHGTAVVEVGDVVRQGELLVSGIVDGAHGDVLLSSKGKVYGRVFENIVIEIPYEQTVKRVKRTEKLRFAINFFGKTINIQRNTGNLVGSYGTIVEKEDWSLPGGTLLPISTVRESAVFYEEATESLTPKEAVRLGYAKLTGRLSALLSDGYIVSKTVTVDAGDHSCLIKCSVTYITNIAVAQPIGLS